MRPWQWVPKNICNLQAWCRLQVPLSCQDVQWMIWTSSILVLGSPTFLQNIKPKNNQTLWSFNLLNLKNHAYVKLKTSFPTNYRCLLCNEILSLKPPDAYLQICLLLIIIEYKINILLQSLLRPMVQNYSSYCTGST